MTDTGALSNFEGLTAAIPPIVHWSCALSLAPPQTSTLSASRADGEASDFAAAVGALRALCANDLEAVDAALLESLSSPVAMIPQLAGHLIKAGGKRLRPLLTLASARACGVVDDRHIKLAAAVELIHGATLLHDDVVDGSKLRRGLSTANVLWGDKESVLVGDFVFSRAFELMVDVGDLDVLRILSRAAGVIAEGEVLQLATQKNLDATYETYLSVVEAKTAALFAAAARVGAVVARADANTEARLGDFGRQLGVAFQLVDDALDYAGREDALGKAVGDDFREGKMTLPVVLALRQADAEARAFWRRTIAEGDQRPGDFAHAQRLIREAGAVDETLRVAAEYAEAASACLGGAAHNAFGGALYDLAVRSTRRAA
ncbi:MAG: polyprenyl synthetase family protein [Parvularculaceae bacterium]